MPAIALTACARVEERMQALRAGYQMRAPKPVELAELVAVAAMVVRRDSQCGVLKHVTYPQRNNLFNRTRNQQGSYQSLRPEPSCSSNKVRLMAVCRFDPRSPEAPTQITDARAAEVEGNSVCVVKGYVSPPQIHQFQ